MKAPMTAAALLSMILAACGPTSAPSPSGDREAKPPAMADGAETPSPAEAPAGASARGATPSPSSLTPEAERGETGARDVLLDFARTIEPERYSQAWALLSPADQRKWSEARFAALFADLQNVTVAVPAGEMEGAAGSLYYTAPVAVAGVQADGRPVRLEGEAVLRRVNDVDGASAAQLRWHFETLTLDWVH